MPTNKTGKKEKTKIKTEWNLGLLYKSTTDAHIEEDVKNLEALFAAFEAKYKTNDSYTKNEDTLAAALSDWEKLNDKGTWKPVMYLNYATDLNAADEKAESLKNKLIQRLTKASNRIVFFQLSLGKIDKNLQEQFLKSSRLSKYAYYLKVIFDTAKHDLSEAEEKIVSLKYLPSRGLWVDGQEKLLNAQMVKFGSKDMPINEAFGQLHQLPTNSRRKLHDTITQKLKDISHFAESEINALYTDKKTMDELRGFNKPYSATILGYQNDEQSIINLVNTVTKSFPISHRFYALKAKLLKTKNLAYADRAARVGKTTKEISFKEGYDILNKALARLDTTLYQDILKRFGENGQIDVYPKKGKRGGAYCSWSTGLPTFVLLNHTNNLNSVMTLGHEMGHAFHGELSKEQSSLYQDAPISIAEVASTLFENFVFEEVFETLTDKEKIIALHDRLNDDIATIFRQIACFNFELDLHTQVREKGFVSKEAIAESHNKNMKAYLGPKFKMKEQDGYFFVSWPHIRNFFYVYSYSYGQIISKAMYKKYKEDKTFVKKIEQFLRAGGSASPEDIFKSIGIDTASPTFFEEGLKQVEEDIKTLEKLIK
jgi:oligoendopeptidase F